MALDKFYIGILFAGIVSVLLLSTHDAAATNTSLDGSAACISLGGSWDNPTSTCSVHHLTINAGDSLDILSGVALSNFGAGDTLDNSGIINILSGGHLVGIGTGGLGGETFTNHAGGELNNQGTIAYQQSFIINSGTINNRGPIAVDHGEISNGATGIINNNPTGTITASGETGFVNAYTINNRGTINVQSGAGLENDGTINNNLGGTISFVGSDFFNAGILNNSWSIVSVTLTNSGTINNRGYIASQVITNRVTGTINNSGVGTIINHGELANRGIINNRAIIDNYLNQIDNYSSGTINNTLGLINNTGGTINNHCTGTINNSGIILGNPINNICP